jgi:hypothetical protein
VPGGVETEHADRVAAGDLLHEGIVEAGLICPGAEHL